MKKVNLFLVLVISLLLCSCTEDKNPEEDYIIEDIVVTTNEFSMPGKLTLPVSESKVPAVVMVHGSGPNNMDEEVGKLKLFKDLSLQLAENGIASIRYDKRVFTYLEEVSTDTSFTIQDEIIDDAISAINILKNDARIDTNAIYVIGHSLGGQFAPVIANKESTIKGVITLAGTTEHIIDVAMRQLQEQNSPYYDTYDPWDEYFRDIKEVKPNETNYFFMGAYETYWVSYNAINFESETLTCAKNKKMLILHGKLDIQVHHSTLETYKELLKNEDKVTYKLYDSLNHMFVDGTNETLQTAYQTEKEVPDYVIKDIVAFITAQ